MLRILIDAGPIIAYYNSGDDWRDSIKTFLSDFRGQFVTTEAVITEALHMLSQSRALQNELLCDLAKELYMIEPLSPIDFTRVAALNTKYANVPGGLCQPLIDCHCRTLRSSQYCQPRLRF